MSPQERAELVREFRLEMKRLQSATDPWRVRDAYGPAATHSRARMEIARTRSRFQRPRRTEDADSYIRRTAEGGDASYGDAAARWDLRRPRGAARAPTWDEGYTSYDGWAERARLRARRRRR